MVMGDIYGKRRLLCSEAKISEMTKVSRMRMKTREEATIAEKHVDE